MKRTPLQRKTPLKHAPRSRKTPLRASKPRKTLPSWLKAIPESQAHGSGTCQKRLWRVVSDYVRIRDWHAHKVCVATGTRINHWTEGQAGHLKPYSNCNALYKFDVRNIHMQSASSNKWGNRDTWKEYEKVVRARGYDIDAFERENRKATGASLRDSEVIEQIKRVLKKMERLPEQPTYYKRATMLLQ